MCSGGGPVYLRRDEGMITVLSRNYFMAKNTHINTETFIAFSSVKTSELNPPVRSGGGPVYLRCDEEMITVLRRNYFMANTHKPSDKVRTV